MRKSLFFFRTGSHCYRVLRNTVRVWGILHRRLSLARVYARTVPFVFIIIGARSASWMILERFQEAHTWQTAPWSRDALKKTAAKLATSRGLHVKQLALAAVWLLFLFDNGSYFAILFASHQWFGEQRRTTIFLEEIAHPCLHR